MKFGENADYGPEKKTMNFWKKFKTYSRYFIVFIDRPVVNSHEKRK